MIFCITKNCMCLYFSFIGGKDKTKKKQTYTPTGALTIPKNFDLNKILNMNLI